MCICILYLCSFTGGYLSVENWKNTHDEQEGKLQWYRVIRSSTQCRVEFKSILATNWIQMVNIIIAQFWNSFWFYLTIICITSQYCIKVSAFSDKTGRSTLTISGAIYHYRSTSLGIACTTLYTVDWLIHLCLVLHITVNTYSSKRTQGPIQCITMHGCYTHQRYLEGCVEENWCLGKIPGRFSRSTMTCITDSVITSTA